MRCQKNPEVGVQRIPPNTPLGMAHIVKQFNSFTCTVMHLIKENEPHPWLPSRNWSSFYQPRSDRRLSRAGKVNGEATAWR